MDAITSCFNCKKSAVVPEMTTLSPEQISMIQTTWSIPAQSPIDSGEAILLAFFEKYPNNQQKFASFKNIPLLSLKGTPGFRTHAGRVITVFNDSVICLDKEDHLAELEALWTKIGESHNKRKISQQAFNELRDVIVNILIQVCSLTEEQKVAWSNLLDIIYNIAFRKMELKAS